MIANTGHVLGSLVVCVAAASPGEEFAMPRRGIAMDVIEEVLRMQHERTQDSSAGDCQRRLPGSQHGC